ncbi:MAG TPA: hypothetical protein VD833_03200 [Vicinamibacterales bacterium]|nr:hypothetical protein [Vicinamibacterales bacterium]
MNDPFVGTWALNPARSEFDPNHRTAQARMTWEPDPRGGYLLLAEGVDEKGTHCVEKPQTLIPDGKSYPVENLPGLSSVTTRPDRHTIRAEALREDGSRAGEGTYLVAEDGRTMTATTTGFDSQLRPFTMRTVWDRV